MLCATVHLKITGFHTQVAHMVLVSESIAKCQVSHAKLPQFPAVYINISNNRITFYLVMHFVFNFSGSINVHMGGIISKYETPERLHGFENVTKAQMHKAVS